MSNYIADRSDMQINLMHEVLALVHSKGLTCPEILKVLVVATASHITSEIVIDNPDGKYHLEEVESAFNTAEAMLEDLRMSALGLVGGAYK